jgi:hypothetical protein
MMDSSPKSTVRVEGGSCDVGMVSEVELALLGTTVQLCRSSGCWIMFAACSLMSDITQ